MQAVRSKEYNAVDIFKFICAILVVLIHTKPFENVFWIDAAIGILTRFAVPYFFISSAFFLFKRLSISENKNAVYKNYFVRLTRFYLIWFLIFNVVSAFRGNSYNVFGYIRQFFFCTNGSPLWFMSALIWASLFVFLLEKVISKKKTLVIACLFWILGYAFSTLRVVLVGNIIFDSINNSVVSFIGTQNGLFFAFPYVALGSVLADKQSIKKEHLFNVTGIIVSLMLLSVESLFAVTILHSDLTFLWLSALPLAYFTMKLTLTMEIGWNIDFYYIRKSSTLLYVIHVLVMRFINDVISQYNIVDTYNLIYFFATIFVSLLLVFVIVSLSKRYKIVKYIM